MGRKVLIVEDDADTLKAMTLRLRAQHVEVVSATDGYWALQVLRKEHPDLVLLDLGLPGGDGLSVLERIKTSTEFALTPVVVISARSADAWGERVLKAGAQAFLSKPVENEALRTVLDRFLGPAAAQAGKQRKILIVEDDGDLRLALTLRLKSAGYQVVATGDATTAVTIATREHPDLTLLDLGLPGGDGLALMERLRRFPPLAAMPFIVLSARDPVVHGGKAQAAGAFAFFHKPADHTALLGAIERALREPTE